MGKKILILITAAVLIMTKNARSEEGKPSKTDFITLEPITVTASRSERKLSSVPSSVSILTREDIDDSNAKSVPDLLKDTEGVYTYDASGVGTAGRINMRGFWGGMSTHQLVLIDGIPQNKGSDKLVDWDLIPLENIERVEILRGPASALYGDNAMSGVINIITQTPSAIPETRAAFSYGSYNTQNYTASNQATYGKIGHYIGAGAKLTNGFRRYCDYEDVYAAGKLNFLFDKTQALRFSADYHEKTRGAYPWAISETQLEEDRRRARPGSQEDKSKAKKLDLGLTYDKDLWEISNAEGTFYFRYQDSNSFYTSGSTGSSTKEQLNEEDTYGLLLRYTINPEFFGMSHSLIAGIDFEINDFDYDEYNAPYQERGDLRQDYNVERHKTGPYAQGEIAILDSLKLIGGIRYDLVTFDFNDYRDERNSKRERMSRVSPKCGIVYTYQKNSNLYADYAQAFRTPTMGQMFTYGSFSNPDLEPERGTNYEVGIRHRFCEYMRANASVYWMKLDNEIWYDYAEEQYRNYGRTSHAGVESGLNFKIGKVLDIFANYTYTSAKNESGDDKGKYLTNIPMHKGSLGARIDTGLGLKLNLCITKVGVSFIDDANDDKLSGYATLDLKMEYEYKNLSAFLAFDNLLNEKYNSYGYKKSSTQVKFFNPAPGTTFTFGGRLTF